MLHLNVNKKLHKPNTTFSLTWPLRSPSIRMLLSEDAAKPLAAAASRANCCLRLKRLPHGYKLRHCSPTSGPASSGGVQQCSVARLSVSKPCVECRQHEAAQKKRRAQLAHGRSLVSWRHLVAATAHNSPPKKSIQCIFYFHSDLYFKDSFFFDINYVQFH